MNTKTYIPSVDSQAMAEATAKYLTPVVIELSALQINGKQAHWHVRGTNFQAIHELLDTLVTQTRDWTDLAAERIVALGMPVDARLGTVHSESKAPELSAGFQPAEVTIREILKQIDAALVVLREAVNGLDEVDLTSQDLVIGITAELDKLRWFFRANLDDAVTEI